MKQVYVVMSDDSRVATFEEKAAAYQSREKFRQNDRKYEYLHVDTQVVFEDFTEWDRLG